MYTTYMHVLCMLYRNVWSKTVYLNRVGGAGEEPLTCNMGTFFLISLTLTKPKNFLRERRTFGKNGEKLESFRKMGKKL